MWNRGYNLRSLAKELKITPTTLSRKMAGQRDFTLKEIETLISLFDTPFEELFRRSVLYKDKGGDRDDGKQQTGEGNRTPASGTEQGEG